MEAQEFEFVYQDLKVQLKEIPSLPLLLKSVEKTTKKLECLNLYSLTDKRQFDFQLFQQNTFDEITTIRVNVTNLKQQALDGSINMEALLELEQRIESLKEKKIEAFDKLSKMEESLQFEIETLVDQNLITAPLHHANQIKQVEEDEEEMAQEQSQGFPSQEGRVDQLKKQIDHLNTKIVKINRGKGKWFQGDHNDFIKIYNRYKGNAQKIIEEGSKILGMKNIEIMDHLELYEGYLQLEKQKKLATQEFKSIKMLQEQTKTEIAFKNQKAKIEKEKYKSKLKEEQNIAKKMQVEEFRRKKAEEHQKIINQASKERENQKKSMRVSSEKRKEIEMRNKRLIEQQKEKFKQRNNSKGMNSSKEKPKPSSILAHNNLKPKLPKPSIPLPQSKISKQ